MLFRFTRTFLSLDVASGQRLKVGCSAKLEGDNRSVCDERGRGELSLPN